jgi:hypothetical protein
MGSTEQIQKLLFAQPTPTLNDLVLHHGDVRRGTTKTRGTQSKQQGSELEQGCPSAVHAGAFDGRTAPGQSAWPFQVVSA